MFKVDLDTADKNQLACNGCGSDDITILGVSTTLPPNRFNLDLNTIAFICNQCRYQHQRNVHNEVYREAFRLYCEQNGLPPVTATPKKIYISGPMSGYDECNRPAFNRAAERILSKGNIPLNPAILPDGLTEPEYMDICMAMLRCADEMLMLPDFENSAGARAEYAMGEKLGLPAAFIKKVVGA